MLPIPLTQIKRLYAKRDESHNFKHIKFIESRVEFLRKGIKGLDENLLKFLIYFHGLKEFVLENSEKFNKEYVKSLLRHNKKPVLIEEKLVFDANMFDNVGERGIRKAIAFGKGIGRSKEETYQYLNDNIKKARFYTKKGKHYGNEEIKIMKSIICN